MRRCWAHSLGNCSDKMTGEHVVGSALFEATVLEVVGMAPMGSISRTVGKASLKAKILCSRHNSELSLLDGEIASLHAAIRRARAEKTYFRYRLNGLLLERWCLRFLTNLLAAGWIQSGAVNPGPDIVRQVFGLDPIVKPSGIYGITDYEGSMPADSVSYAVLQRPGDDRHVLGICISLSGLLLLHSTCRADLQELVRANGNFGQFSLHRATTHHHPSRMQLGDRGIEGANRPSLMLELSWQRMPTRSKT